VLEQDFEQAVGHWAHMFSRSFERVLNDELAQHKITLRQCQVLAWLAMEEELSQAQLADRLRIEPPTLVRILDRMERDGWIERHTTQEDRRKKTIRATQKVKPIWNRILACIRRVRAQSTQGIDPVDLATAKRVLIEMRQNLLGGMLTEEAGEAVEAVDAVMAME